MNNESERLPAWAMVRCYGVLGDLARMEVFTPTDKESPIHWSKTAIREWIKNHRKVGDRGTFV